MRTKLLEWITMSKKIYSRCGNQCNLCLIYRPNVEKEDRRVDICAVFDKLGPNTYDPATTICDGCLSENKPDNGCKARPCVIERGLQHCGYCPDYPCAIFPAEPNAEEFYNDVKRRGVHWTAEDDHMMEPYNPKKVMDEWRNDQGNGRSVTKPSC